MTSDATAAAPAPRAPLARHDTEGSLGWPIVRAMAVHGRELAMVDGDVRMTYAEWGRRILGLPAGLRALGLGDGDVVAVLSANSYRYVECWLGIPAGGLVINPLNYRLAVPELAFIINDSEAKAIIADDTFLAMARELLPQCASLQHLVYAGDAPTPDGATSYDELCTHTPIGPDVTDRLDVHTLAAIMYTGGTTGLPKGVMMSHGNLTSNAKHIVPTMEFTEHSVYLHAAPMFHAADVASTFAVTWVGARHVVLRTFDPAVLCDLIEEERVTVTLLVPTMINALVNVPGVEARDFSSWQLLAYGASPMPLELQRRAMELLPCGFMQLYGMTEASPLLTKTSVDDHRRGAAGEPGYVDRLRSAGAPVPGVQTQVRRDDGITECEPGEAGEVFARGPNLMLGYWKRPEETAKALAGGWYRTGDVAYADECGYLYIVDRAKDMIISGGENVYTTEVENAVYAHPAVLEAAAFGIPHDTWGEAVHVEVVVKPGHAITPEELIAHCRTLIGGFKVPRSVHVRTDALPKSGAAKILKRDLRAPFWEGRERNVN